jgi:hypothetical protein
LIFLCGLSGWQYNLQIISYEFVVEVGKSKEIMDILVKTWTLLFQYCLNFLWILEAIFGWSGITQELNFFAIKIIVLQFGLKTIILRLCCRVNQQII